MRTIYIGYSTELEANAIIELLEPSPSESSGASPFQRAFKSGMIRPGNFEVFRPNHPDIGLMSPETLKMLWPFDPGDIALFEVDLSTVKAILWIHDDADWDEDEALGIKITDRIEIAKFKWE
ncbi:MAG: hypothetical protein AAGF12_15100 [Myxococcota bacterium]